MKPDFSNHRRSMLAVVASVVLVMVGGACRSNESARTGREPWAKQTRHEVERNRGFKTATTIRAQAL